MVSRVKMRKIGSSYHFLIPSSLIDVFNLTKDITTHDYEVNVYNKGKIISFKKQKMSPDKSQTTLTKFEEKKK